MTFENKDIRKDFPVLDSFTYLDNASTTQKPIDVINGVQDFILNRYANIHRGSYGLSEMSENLYHESKELYGKHINSGSHPIIYSYNATFCINQVVLSLEYSGFLNAGDKILIGRWEHHANMLPWIELAKRRNILIEYIELDKNGQIDIVDFNSKYSDNVKVIGISMYSNVLGHSISITEIEKRLGDQTFFLVDGSQLIPHKKFDFYNSRIDCLISTAHKMLAYTGLGVISLKKNWINAFQPNFVGGGVVKGVALNDVDYVANSSKFEPGTPNIISAVSLLYALKYINKIGGMDRIQEIEQKQKSYCIDQFLDRSNLITLIDEYYVKSDHKGNVFSFVLNDKQVSLSHFSQKLADKNICVRTGAHCAYPLHQQNGLDSTIRMSPYFYNTIEDIDAFFYELDAILK